MSLSVFVRRQERGRACRIAALVVVVGALSFATASQAADDVGLSAAGVVVLHGKATGPKAVESLATVLRRYGARVEVPEMAWGHARIYDRSYEDSLLELRSVVDRLAGDRVRYRFIVGQSLGANVALGYAARHGGIDGIGLLAAGHFPENESFARLIDGGIAKARALVRAGKGWQTFSAEDFDTGTRLRVVTTPDIYLSWMSPDGPANMANSAVMLGGRIPVLWVAGRRDPLAAETGRREVFDRLAPHPLHRIVLVDADHFGTPAVAASVVRDWLRDMIAASSAGQDNR